MSSVHFHTFSPSNLNFPPCLFTIVLLFFSIFPCLSFPNRLAKISWFSRKASGGTLPLCHCFTLIYMGSFAFQICQLKIRTSAFLAGDLAFLLPGLSLCLWSESSSSDEYFNDTLCLDRASSYKCNDSWKKKKMHSTWIQFCWDCFAKSSNE